MYPPGAFIVTAWGRWTIWAFSVRIKVRFNNDKPRGSTSEARRKVLMELSFTTGEEELWLSIPA